MRHDAGDDASRRSSQQVRALSGGFARVAEVAERPIVDSCSRRATAGSTTRTIASVTSSTSTGSRSPRLFDYVLRLQVRDAVLAQARSTTAAAIRRAPDARGRVPRPRRLHRAQPGARGRRARRARRPVRGAHPRHGRRARRAGREDDRRRGDVRRPRRPRSPRRSRCGSPSGPRDDEVLPDARAGLAYGSVRRPGGRLLRAGREPRPPARRARVPGHGPRRPTSSTTRSRSDPFAFQRCGPALPGSARFVTSGGSATWRRCEPGDGSERARVALAAHDVTPPTPLRLLSVHAHPDDEASKGAAHGRQVRRRGHPRRARVLHRRRGGRDPQPGGRHARRSARNLHEVRMQELQDSVDAIGYEKLYMLGYRDSGMKDTEANAQPGQLRERAARRGGRAAGAHHPRRAAAGDHHLRRRQQVLPAPRPRPGARDLRSGVRRGRRPGRVPRRGRAVAAAEDVLHGLVGAADPRAARGVHRARRGEPVRAVVRARGFDEHADDQLHDLRRRRATSCASGARRCSRTARRSTRPGSGCGCRTTSCARSSRGRSSCSPARSSTPGCPRATRGRSLRRPARRRPALEHRGS